MAKVVIAGNAAVITSAMKLEDLRTIAKYRPEALTLRGGDDGKEPIFAICLTNGNGKIDKLGVSFGTATRDDEKLATLTLFLSNVDGDVKEYVTDKLGSALINLNKLEETLPDVLAEIASEKAIVMEAITVAQ